MTRVDPAATVMVTRNHHGELEVLLVKRNRSLAFAGGLWVFPGGRIDGPELESSSTELDAARLAAVREVKEETNLTIDESGLVFFRHWTTPKAEPRRFATYFFFAEVSASEAVTVDDGEIKDYKWMRPSDVLAQLDEGQMGMMPPTIMSIQLIHKCRSVDQAREFLRTQPILHILPTMVIEGRRVFCLFEGDAGFPSGKIHAKGARHRISMEMATGKFEFECSADEKIVPVNGGMHV